MLIYIYLYAYNIYVYICIYIYTYIYIYIIYIYHNSVYFIIKVVNIIRKQYSNLYQNDKEIKPSYEVYSEFDVSKCYNLQTVHNELRLKILPHV